MAGTIFFNRFSISPTIDPKFIRVVVDWDQTPRDLDAHLVKKDDYHISFRTKQTSSDGNAMLDRDATNGFGPETITAKEISKQSIYEYYIHDYSNQGKESSRGLSKSKSSVKVYGDGKLLKVFYIPKDVEGTYWDVFKIIDGKIVEVNELRKKLEN